MTAKEPKYPLEQVLAVKKDRVEKAEKVVKEKKKALEIEEEKLKKIQKERDIAFNHHRDKLTQLRKALDEGTTSDEVIRMKAYLKIVKEKLQKEEEKLKEQQKHVKTAEQNLENAKKELNRRRIEEEKIHLHKDHWKKEVKKEMDREEAKEHDEIGTAMYEAQKRKKIK